MDTLKLLGGIAISCMRAVVANWAEVLLLVLLWNTRRKYGVVHDTELVLAVLLGAFVIFSNVAPISVRTVRKMFMFRQVWLQDFLLHTAFACVVAYSLRYLHPLLPALWLTVAASHLLMFWRAVGWKRERDEPDPHSSLGI